MSLVFVDRDGVINRFPGQGFYVTSLDAFEMLPGSAKAIALLNREGFEVVVISNQGCVSRGFLSEEGLAQITDKMVTAVRKEGGALSGIFYCKHQTSDNCGCKKPKTGLFEQAMRTRSDNLASVFFIGDSQEDVEAGKAAGCRTLLVLSGRSTEADLKNFKIKPDIVKKDLWEAATWITQKKS